MDVVHIVSKCASCRHRLCCTDKHLYYDATANSTKHYTEPRPFEPFATHLSNSARYKRRRESLGPRRSRYLESPNGHSRRLIESLRACCAEVVGSADAG